MSQSIEEPEIVIAGRGKSKRMRIAIVAIIVSVVVVIAAFTLWLSTPGELLRMTVSLSSESPQPYEPFTVSAQVEGGAPLSPIDVQIEYLAYANGSQSGGGTPVQQGNKWTFELPGFEDGSEVWIIVAAATANQEPVFQHMTVRIGNVLHGGPSGLAISDVIRTPEQPDSLDTVSVSAKVTGSANVSRVMLLARCYHWTFDWLGRGFGGGGGGGPMFEGSPGNYSLALIAYVPPGIGGGGTERGTIWVYRIAAWDSTWNTAVTSVETFTIS